MITLIIILIIVYRALGLLATGLALKEHGKRVLRR